MIQRQSGTRIFRATGLFVVPAPKSGRIVSHGELRRAIGGGSQKMLTQTLRTIERDQLVRRTIYPVVPPRVDYALTPLGETLMQPLSALYRWIERHPKKIQQTHRESQKTRRVARVDKPGVTETRL